MSFVVVVVVASAAAALICFSLAVPVASTTPLAMANLWVVVATPVAVMASVLLLLPTRRACRYLRRAALIAPFAARRCMLFRAVVVRWEFSPTPMLIVESLRTKVALQGSRLFDFDFPSS